MAWTSRPARTDCDESIRLFPDHGVYIARAELLPLEAMLGTNDGHKAESPPE